MPEGLAPYIAESGSSEELVRNAMLLYPHIRSLEISHGRAAELLGINKLDLIDLYDSLGMPYLNQSRESLLQELAGFSRTASEA